MNMKKILIGIGIFIGLVFLGGAGFYAWYTQSTPYYTQITTTGKKFDVIDDETGAARDIDYAYTQMAYDEKGHDTEVDFNGHKSRPLKMQAYLRLDYSTRRNQVISWEAVPKEKVPEAALAKLNR